MGIPGGGEQGGGRFWDHQIDIAQDSSLGPCLTSSWAEISKKKKKKIVAQIGGQNDLFYSNVVEDSLKLACLNSNK